MQYCARAGARARHGHGEDVLPQLDDLLRLHVGSRMRHRAQAHDADARERSRSGPDALRPVGSRRAHLPLDARQLVVEDLHHDRAAASRAARARPRTVASVSEPPPLPGLSADADVGSPASLRKISMSVSTRSMRNGMAFPVLQRRNPERRAGLDEARPLDAVRQRRSAATCADRRTPRGRCGPASRPRAAPARASGRGSTASARAAAPRPTCTT